MNSSASINAPLKIKKYFTWILIIAILIASGNKIGADFGKLAVGIPQMGNLFAEMFPPDWKYFNTIQGPLVETIRMAILGTTIGGILSVPFALLAARNINKSKLLYYPIRFILNIIRTIPDLLFASIFVAIFGIGALSGVMALAAFSFGIIVKLLYEELETIDEGPVEAMTAVGANKIQIIKFAIVPQVLPQFVSNFLYTLEINVRAATVLGLVGAGGIGENLNTTLGFYRYDQTAIIIIATLVLVVIIDGMSAFIREKLI